MKELEDKIIINIFNIGNYGCSVVNEFKNIYKFHYKINTYNIDINFNYDIDKIIEDSEVNIFIVDIANKEIYNIAISIIKKAKNYNAFPIVIPIMPLDTEIINKTELTYWLLNLKNNSNVTYVVQKSDYFNSCNNYTYVSKFIFNLIESLVIPFDNAECPCVIRYEFIRGSKNFSLAIQGIGYGEDSAKEAIKKAINSKKLNIKYIKNAKHILCIHKINSEYPWVKLSNAIDLLVEHYIHEEATIEMGTVIDNSFSLNEAEVIIFIVGIDDSVYSIIDAVLNK